MVILEITSGKRNTPEVCSKSSYDADYFPVQAISKLHEGDMQSLVDPQLQGEVNFEEADGLFVWLVADGWCWFILREKYCWPVAGGWFVPREKYCWLVADKPSEQAVKGFVKLHFGASKIVNLTG
jgi:hypothetical protein